MKRRGDDLRAGDGLLDRGTILPRDSVANVSQVLTIDRGRLTERVRRLPSRVVAQVDDGLRLALAL